VAVSDFLANKQQEIVERLNQLKPAMDEYTRLEAAAEALAALDGRSANSADPLVDTVTRGRPGRPSRSRKPASKATASSAATATPAKAARKTTARQKARSGRPKGSGARAAETLSLIQGQPGITISELATGLGIKANYLYRVLPVLLRDGKIAKKGRGWHPKGK
jgi:hypothetical protein